MKSRVEVRDVTVSTIKPSEKTDHVKSIQPNFQDLITSDAYFPALFAYKLRDSEDEYQKFASQLKTSLEKVLVPFYPYAGRWVPDGGHWTVDGRRGFLLDCNDEGVPFIEAYVDRDIDSVVHAGGGFEAVPELNGHEVLGMDSSVVKQKMLPSGLPPIFIQRTVSTLSMEEPIGVSQNSTQLNFISNRVIKKFLNSLQLRAVNDQVGDILLIQSVSAVGSNNSDYFVPEQKFSKSNYTSPHLHY